MLTYIPPETDYDQGALEDCGLPAYETATVALIDIPAEPAKRAQLPSFAATLATAPTECSPGTASPADENEFLEIYAKQKSSTGYVLIGGIFQCIRD